ncbi:MAG: NAD-dependent epimerase/dehydratase family protein [Acidobacteria bacterium]|nr:NAD-dependent epimerase/dehydratase family protein [Acidobacteriota bacterium]
MLLITGGAGFIGSCIVRRWISAGRSVRVLDNLSEQIHGKAAGEPTWASHPLVDFVRGSVTERSDWVRALDGVREIVHLAAETGTAQSMYEISRYTTCNAIGTGLMLEALRESTSSRVRRVLLASSRSIYGEGAYRCDHCGLARTIPDARTGGDLAAGRWEPRCPVCAATLTAIPTSESDPPRTASIYAATKWTQEEYVRIGCASLGIDHAILRLQNVYGEGQSLQNPYTGILSIFSNRIRVGSELPIFEDGLESRDFVHVEDVAWSFLAAIDRADPIAGVINVGSGRATSVAEVAHQLGRALGLEARTRVTGQYRLGDIRHNFADISRLQAVLGYRPQISLEEGLGRFARWVLSRAHGVDRLDSANRELVERGLMGVYEGEA